VQGGLQKKKKGFTLPKGKDPRTGGRKGGEKNAEGKKSYGKGLGSALGWEEIKQSLRSEEVRKGRLRSSSLRRKRQSRSGLVGGVRMREIKEKVALH